MTNKEPLYKIGQEVIEKLTGRKGKIKSIAPHNSMRPDYYIVFDNSDDSEELDERFINEPFIKPVEPNTHKYGIGSRIKDAKNGSIYLVEDFFGSNVTNAMYYGIKEQSTGEKLTLLQKEIDETNHIHLYTENQWNDYHPNVEPEVGRWVEWSGSSLKFIRYDNVNYKFLSLVRDEVSSLTLDWSEMGDKGQWRYCDAPHIDVATKAEAVENQKNHTVKIGQKWKSKANRLVYEIADLKHDSNKDEWEVFIKTTQHPYGSWIMVHSLVSNFTYEDDSKDEGKNTLTDEQFLKFVEGIKGLHPNGTTKSNVQNMHNNHYEALAPHKPWDVFEVWVKANEDLFKQHPTLSGYYSPVLKYLGRLTTKEGESPVKNLEKAIAHIQKMIEVLENNND